MLKKIVTLLVVLLLLATPALADELGFGGALVDGHSDTGDYSMSNTGSQEYGLVLHYDHDRNWRKTFEHSAIGVDPGMAYIYARWTKGNNKTQEKCKSFECWQYEEKRTFEWCTEEEYVEREKINSHILAGYLKPYFEYREKVRLFGLFGPGIEIADDETNPAIVMGGGIQYRFTDHVAASLTQYEVFSEPFSDYRRFDVTAFSIDILF